MIVSARCSFRWSLRFSAFQLLHTRVDRTWGRAAPTSPHVPAGRPAHAAGASSLSASYTSLLGAAAPPARQAGLHASACLRMPSRYSAVNRRRWAIAGTSGSGAVAADVAVGPTAPVALRAPSAFGPTTTSISTAGGMRFIHQTLPAPTLISIGRLSHRSLAQGARPCHSCPVR